jgi:cell wall-associated NlpC family hydrolase
MSVALTGKGLVKFAESKLGTPYVYGAKGGVLSQNQINSWARSYPNVYSQSYINKAMKFVGMKCTDCSGLISWYTGKVLGSATLYSQAVKRITISNIDKAPVGAILWKSGHVGVYLGNGYCIEAKGINYGTVKTKVSATAWKYALIMSYISYDDVVEEVAENAMNENPYPKPTRTLKLGMTGDDVKWLQWELQEAGYDIKSIGGIDGDFGGGTLKYVKTLQQSCKIDYDGKVGPITISHFIGN